jgi:hypothetical protein
MQPWATVEMIRDGDDVRVVFRPVSISNTNPVPGYPPGFVEPLPLDFYQSFGRWAHGYGRGHQFEGKGWEAVCVTLEKQNGKVDLMPMLAACDWLRDRDWKICPLGWCAKHVSKG